MMCEITYKGLVFSKPIFLDQQKNRGKTNYAIKCGLLKRQPCEVCGKENAFAHHEDYSKYLKARWLCRGHHRAVHAVFERMERERLTELNCRKWLEREPDNQLAQLFVDKYNQIGLLNSKIE